MTTDELVALSQMSEAELRAFEVPLPESIEEVSDIIKALTERQHDYGTCIYAMSIAATAAFNFVAHKLGVTGFQSSCADLDILRRTRLMKCPFTIIKAEDLLYPQYDVRQGLEEFIASCQPWLVEEAKEVG